MRGWARSHRGQARSYDWRRWKTQAGNMDIAGPRGAVGALGAETAALAAFVLPVFSRPDGSAQAVSARPPCRQGGRLLRLGLRYLCCAAAALVLTM